MNLTEREFVAKVFTNKNTGQRTISIPKRKVLGKLPKELNVKIKW